ncbi:hypothetical protein MMC20_007984 [Loxospora ochrophaea]|nr:hypothetical protein [Loxospora ochrophaea]
MRSVIFHGLALAVFTSAQSLSDLPSCAVSCVGNGLSSTGCAETDFKCICSDSAWIGQLTCCVESACDQADQQTTVQFADQICKTVNIDLPANPVCSTASGASTMSAAATAGTMGTTESTMASGTMGSTMASGMMASTMASSTMTAESSMGTATAATGSESPTGSTTSVATESSNAAPALLGRMELTGGAAVAALLML